MFVRRTAALAAALTLVLLAQTRDATLGALSPDVVISQVYGGGGNSGATLRADFIELHNRSGVSVPLDGWSVQYASSTGSTWQFTRLTGTIAPGGYYLVQQAPGSGGTQDLPQPDATGSIPMSATAGKVALVSHQTPLTGSCPAGLTPVVDFVGFGPATNCFETQPTPALSNTTAAVRKEGGSIETDHNFADFVVAAPFPRNTRWGVTIDDVTVTEGDSGEVTAAFTVSFPAGHTGVTFDIATIDGTATSGDGDYFARAESGVSVPAGTLTYSFPVLVSGDTKIEPTETFEVRLLAVTGAPVGDRVGLGTIANDDNVVAPTIAQHPVDVAVPFNESVTLTVSASGTAPLTYAWYEGASGLTAAPVGENAASFTTPPLVATTSYWVRVSNAGGGADSAAAVVTVLPPPPPCSATDRSIGAVQGTGNATPFTGQVVTVQGVVVGDFEGPLPALRGFYLQDAGDGDAATSDGVFVFNNNTDSVALGRVVQVTGRVTEFQGQTQVTPQNIEQCEATLDIAPVDVLLPVPTAVAGVDYLERFEGMLVRFPQTLTATESFQLGRFGEVVMSANGRLPQPTHVARPGAAAQAQQAENRRHRIIVDDDQQNQNADPIRFGRGGDELTAINTLRGGDTASGMVGVMTFTWAGAAASGNAYRLRPIGALGGVLPDFQPANPRPTSPPDVGGRLTIASFNVLNYFLTLDVGTQTNCGPLGARQECRGAESAEELQRQRAKLTSALVKLNADVVGLIEIENTQTASGLDVNPLAAIVGDLNAAVGAGTYDYVNTGIVGTDAIRVGLIYKPASVLPVGAPLVDDAPVHNRPPVAQTFAEATTGERLSVVVNHFKSKGSCPAAGAPGSDAGDGQGCWNEERVAQSQALLAFVGREVIPAAQDPDVLLLGDFNAYAKEDPIAALEAGGFTNLIALHGGAAAYSYVFDGQWGYLDHGLASASLVAQVTGAADYHINADEPNVLDYNLNFKTLRHRSVLYAPDEFRTSDHDPVVIGLAPYSEADLSASLVPLSAEVAAGATATFTATITNNGSAPARNVVVTNGAAQIAAFAFLPAGVSQQVTLTYATTCAMADGTVIGGAITVSADTSDPDTTNNTASAPVTVANAAPTLTGLTASHTTLWPADHRMVTVTLGYAAADTCGGVTTSVSVTSNEAVSGTGDGDTSPDWNLVDSTRVQLRAERAGGGVGRVYTVRVTAPDAAGASTSADVLVTGPHSRR